MSWTPVGTGRKPMSRNEVTGEPDAGKLGTSGSEGSGRKRSGNATSPATYPTPKRMGALILRLIAGLALLGWPRVSSAQGTWSVIPLPQTPGEVLEPRSVAV